VWLANAIVHLCHLRKGTIPASRIAEIKKAKRTESFFDASHHHHHRYHLLAHK